MCARPLAALRSVSYLFLPQHLRHALHYLIFFFLTIKSCTRAHYIGETNVEDKKKKDIYI